MNKFKVALFDVDGVLILPPRLFSEIYCEKYGKDLDRLTSFYKSKEFKDASIGKLDLKSAIEAHQDKWQWDGDLDRLINEWLEAEDYPNEELVAHIDKLRSSGIKVYIVTQQERYRANYLRDKVFSGKYDGFLASCDLGLHKDTVEFWESIVRQVGENPEDIIYFDDKQKLVELAQSVGIQGHVYTTVSDVKRLLS